MLSHLWTFHQPSRMILLQWLCQCLQPWYPHDISSSKVSHIIGHLPVITAAYGVILPVSAASVSTSREFTVNVVALELPTTMSGTTKPIPVPDKLRMTTTFRGLTTTDMLCANLDVTASSPISDLRQPQPFQISCMPGKPVGAVLGAWSFCGHRNDKGTSKCTTQPNNGYL